MCVRTTAHCEKRDSGDRDSDVSTDQVSLASISSLGYVWRTYSGAVSVTLSSGRSSRRGGQAL